VSLLREVRWLAEPALYVGLMREGNGAERERGEGDGNVELAMFNWGLMGVQMETGERRISGGRFG
jgi:hypothetical protein